MIRKLALCLATALCPVTTLAAVAPVGHGPTTHAPALAAAPRVTTLVDGTVVRPAAPHGWRANAEVRHARDWAALTAELGHAWATWDPHTEHPRQILATGRPSPGVVASAAEAERVAREVLTRHVELLAPGSRPDDFVLVANVESGGVRSVGFAQHADGRPVLGGQIGFSFAHDRLVLITSLAQPHVLVASAPARVTDTTARDRARTWIVDDLSPAIARTVGPVEGPMILPVQPAGTATSPAPLGAPRYREVVRVEVQTEAPHERFWVYLDAETGETVARESRLLHATGRVLYDVSERSPIFPRGQRPTPWTRHIVGGALQLSDAGGFVTFPGASTTVEPGLDSPYVALVDEAGPSPTADLMLSAGGTAVWSAADDEFDDAALTTYAHLLFVKGYARTFAPDLAWLDAPITATINIDDGDGCNASSDGDAVYFLRANDVCENTGRMSDVVYHEVGHSIHQQSIIPGVGSFDGGLSEGVSDYLSATITGDSGVGRGFFFNEDPLRELDPPGSEWTWPDDNGEVHDAGRIIGGVLWDLRTLLIAKYGAPEGIARTDHIYYQATRRAVDMPTMYGAALLVNDDDGDLSNGTPDACEINEAFGVHGLFSGLDDGEHVSATEVPEGLLVHADISVPVFEACPLQVSLAVEWGPRDGGPTEVAPLPLGGGGYETVIPPLPPGEVMRYRVLVDYSVGTQRILPANLGDPWFQHWFGEVEPIYCTSFEDGAPDWEIPLRWEVDAPAGLGGDPEAAAGPDPLVLGLDLLDDGYYPPWTSTTASSPVIAIPSAYESVRLHYWRWLTVEDAYFDRATILADGSPAWTNFASVDDETATVHHRDRQWVFHDVDLSPWVDDGQVQLSFALSSDGGLEMGGWTVDELCVVGYAPIPAPVCGNGVPEATEACDDGNVVAGDGCDASCQLESPPDDDPIDPEPTDPGQDDPDDVIEGGLIDRGCACRASSRDDLPVGTALLALWLIAWRRRRG